MKNIKWRPHPYASGVASGRRALELAELSGDTGLCAMARYRLGIPYLQLGQVRAASEQLEAALEYFESPLGREVFEFGGYPYCFVTTFLAWAYAELGEFERATEVGQAGYKYAVAREHGYSLVCAAFGLGRALILRGRTDAARAVLEEALSYPDADSASPIRYVLVQLAYIYALRGEPAQLDNMRQFLSAVINRAMTEAWSHFWMARAELEIGNLAQAESALSSAEEAAHLRKEEAAGAWCNLLRAELDLRRDNAADVFGYIAQAREACARLDLIALDGELDKLIATRGLSG